MTRLPRGSAAVLLAFLVGGVCFPRPVGAQADPPAVELVSVPPSTCAGPEVCLVDLDVPHPAEVVVPGDDERPGNRVRLLLPPGYGGGAAGQRPVLFLLHGAGDGSETWTENSTVEELVADLCSAGPATCPVVVMPDGGGKHSETGWYTDWHDGSRHWETFHIEHVIPWAKDNLAVAACPGRWMVAGLSMGGFGSMSYAARHPDLFHAAATFSGFLDTRPAPPLSTAGFEFAQQNGLGAPTEDMFGPSGTPAEKDGWSEHNPTELARDGAYAPYEGRIWLATGTGTPGGPGGDQPDNAPAYLLEAFIFELNQNFRLAMAQAGTSFVDQSYLGGLHDWNHWDYALRTALPEMLESLEPACTLATGVETPVDLDDDDPVAPEPPAVTMPGELPATGHDDRSAVGVVLLVLAFVFGHRPRQSAPADT